MNHLVLDGGLELSGKVVARVVGPRPAASGLRTAAARLTGPVLLSRGGTAFGKPWPGEAVIAFGAGALPPRGVFHLVLGSGLHLTGFKVGEHEVVDLRATLGERALALPTRALLFLSGSLPSVAGGPADRSAWDHWFGELDAFVEGDGEARARARKAGALAPELAALYREVRRMRAEGDLDPARLAAMAHALDEHPDDWLLRVEVEELRAQVAPRVAAC